MEDKEVKFHEEVQKMEYEPLDETEMKLIHWSWGLGVGLLVVLFLIVASVVAFYLWTRLKNKKSKNGSRKLTRAGLHRSGIAKESRV